MSVRHWAATTAPRNSRPNCYAEQSHKDNVRSSAVGKQLKLKKSNSPAQHHLPALDLFRASFFVRVQLTSLLLISPGLCCSEVVLFFVAYGQVIQSLGVFTIFIRDLGHSHVTTACKLRNPVFPVLYVHSNHQAY